MIPLNDFPRQWEDIGADALAAFAAVGAGGWYILGREVAAFEESLARYWGAAFSVGVGSGLDAIEISLRALGCRAGDRVLTTPLSAFPTTLAILKLGAVPVFVDTDEFGLLDLALCRAALAAGVRYFLPVHLYGHALDMRQLAALRREFDCRLVEDCAQSIGACRDGLPTGSAGLLAAVSFYPTKNLGALGDGGAILAGDAALDRAARSLRDYGQSARYRHERIGYNSRLDELQAAYLHRAALPRLPGWIAARRRIAAAYLAGIRHPAVRPMGAPPGSDSSWHLFPVLVPPEDKAGFLRWMHARGIVCGEHYPIPIPEQPVMAGVRFEVCGSLANTARICRSEVSLPIHPYLTDAEVAQVIEACNAWR